MPRYSHLDPAGESGIVLFCSPPSATSIPSDFNIHSRRWSRYPTLPLTGHLGARDLAYRSSDFIELRKDACLMTFSRIWETGSTVGERPPADGEGGWIEKMLVG
jgi:hypothetical protein